MYTQHRFYGESMPFGNDSYKSADTLGYLTSTQALADLAILITSLKSNLSVPDAPVVVFGGSYGGSKHYAHPLIYPNAYPSCWIFRFVFYMRDQSFCRGSDDLVKLKPMFYFCPIDKEYSCCFVIVAGCCL
jgi:hypothetical protein